MGKKKATRTAVNQQPTKEVITQPQLAEILRLKKEIESLKEKATAEQTKAARKKELEDKLWHAQQEVQGLKAQVCGDLVENLNDFAFWT